MTSNWYATHRFTALLLAGILLFVVHPFLREFGAGPWLYHVLFTVMFLAAFLILYNREGHRLVAVALGLPTLLASWLEILPGDFHAGPLAVPLQMASAVFLGLTVVTILTTIHEMKVITADGLAGAFSGYLMAAVAFALLYSALDLVTPGSFRGPDDLASQLADPAQRHMVFTYFSLITLTTVGYGDIVPATSSARALACVEAVVGQFYIAVVMALLIGRSLAHGGGGDRAAPSP
jgi:hypothetical protein